MECASVNGCFADVTGNVWISASKVRVDVCLVPIYLLSTLAVAGNVLAARKARIGWLVRPHFQLRKAYSTSAAVLEAELGSSDPFGVGFQV